MRQKAISIINYNDAVSNDEILKMELNEVRKNQESVAECIDNDETASRLSVLLKSKYSIPDLISGNVNRTIFRVR